MAKSKTKKILLIQYAFPPIKGAEPAVSAKTIRFLADQGYEIRVVSSSALFSMDGQDKSLLQYLNHRNIKVTKLPTFESKIAYIILSKLFPSLLALPDYKIVWRFWAKAYLSFHLKNNRYDYVYSRSHYLSSHCVALFVNKKFGIPWFAHFSDPWTTDNAYSCFPSKWSADRNAQWEDDVLKRCKFISYSSKYTLSNVARKYPAYKQKLWQLVHSFDPSLYPPKKQRGNKLVFAHVGNFYGKRSCRPVLEAIEDIVKVHPDVIKKISFMFIGGFSINEKKLIKNFKYKEAIDVVGSVNYIESLKLIKSSDALLVVDAPASVNQFLPSKLIDYLGSGNYILGITSNKGATADVVRKVGGTIVSTYDRGDIARAILRAAKTKNNLKIDPKKASDYSIQNAHQNLLRWINSI